MCGYYKQNGKWHVLEINPRFTSSYNGILECYGKKTYINYKSYLTKNLILDEPKLLKIKKLSFHEKENTKYIGIDIGGAHLKCVGIDNSKISYINMNLIRFGTIKRFY